MLKQILPWEFTYWGTKGHLVFCCRILPQYIEIYTLINKQIDTVGRFFTYTSSGEDIPSFTYNNRIVCGDADWRSWGTTTNSSGADVPYRTLWRKLNSGTDCGDSRK